MNRVLYVTLTRSWRERLFSWPWRPWVRTVEMPLKSLVTPAVRPVRPPEPDAQVSAPRPALRAMPPRPRTGLASPAAPRQYTAADVVRDEGLPVPPLFLRRVHTPADPPEPRHPDTGLPFVSGGGGDYAGAGATASWAADDTPAPAAAPKPATSTDEGPSDDR